VNDEKTKLIGLIHYNFTPNLEDFEAMDNMLIKFQRSIDSDACICISSKLQQQQNNPTSAIEFGMGSKRTLVSQSHNVSKNQTYDTLSQI